MPFGSRCHLLLQEIVNLLGREEMIHLLGRDPDHVIGHVFQAQVRISHAEKAIQKIFSKIYRCLHVPIIANSIAFGTAV